MSARLTTALLVSAIVRHTNNVGGNATVLAKGDESAGSILILACEKGRATGVFERILGPDGAYQWGRVGPQNVEDEAAVQQYLEQRRARDPDLWLIELDIAEAARFTAQLTAFG
jgi:hypothetical protein